MSASSVEEAVRVVDQVLMDTLDMDPDIGDADIVLDALSAMPLASRLALARALVPEMVVVPREATEGMLKAGAEAQWRKMQDMASPSPTERPEEGGGSLGYAYRAMLTAAEKEAPDGP